MNKELTFAQLIGIMKEKGVTDNMKLDYMEISSDDEDIVVIVNEEDNTFAVT